MKPTTIPLMWKLMMDKLNGHRRRRSEERAKRRRKNVPVEVADLMKRWRDHLNLMQMETQYLKHHDILNDRVH